jgi:hypothetical protein
MRAIEFIKEEATTSSNVAVVSQNMNGVITRNNEPDKHKYLYTINKKRYQNASPKS